MGLTSPWSKVSKMAGSAVRACKRDPARAVRRDQSPPVGGGCKAAAAEVESVTVVVVVVAFMFEFVFT